MEKWYWQCLALLFSVSNSRSVSSLKSFSRLVCVFSLAIVPALLPVRAETTAIQAPSVDVYGQLPKISMMVISPSGEKIAYRVTENERDAFVAYDLKAKKIIAGVNLKDIRPSTAYFIEENTLIFVVDHNTRIMGYRGRHNVSVAFSYDIQSQKLVQLLIPGRDIHDGQTQVGRIVGVSRDKEYVFMPTYFDAANYGLAKVKLNTRSRPRSMRRGARDATDFFMHNEAVIARERFHNERNLHRVEAFVDGGWREIFREETEVRHRSFNGVTADGKHLIMVKEAENGRWAYYKMALADGAISGPLYNPENKDIEQVITDINRVVYGVRYSGFKPTYQFFDPAVQKQVDNLLGLFPDEAVYILDHTPNWDSIIFLLTGNSSANDYYVYRNGKVQFLAAPYPNIAVEQINLSVVTQLKARDGLNIPTLVTVPNNREPANLPTILLPHGGPESYDKYGFNWLVQYFASQGYLVVQPQFRGSTGFGREHTLAGRGEWGRKMQDDLTDAINVLAKAGYVDKSRVCIVGISYGGYAALAGAAFTPELYQCAVAINGVSDVKRMLRNEKRDNGKGHWVVEYWQKLLTEGKLAEDHLEQISPINFVEKVKAPVLLIHGERDKVVPYQHSEYMYDELKDAGKPVTYVELEKGDHYLSRGANRVEALHAIDRFVKQHL